MGTNEKKTHLHNLTLWIKFGTIFISISYLVSCIIKIIAFFNKNNFWGRNIEKLIYVG